VENLLNPELEVKSSRAQQQGGQPYVGRPELDIRI